MCCVCVRMHACVCMCLCVSFQRKSSGAQVWGTHPYLDIVRGKYSAEIKDLKHGSSTVVSDAVALQNILSDHHFPSQPALAKRSIKGQHMRNMARLTAAKSFIFFHTFCYGFHFSLLTIGTLKKDRTITDNGKENSNWENECLLSTNNLEKMPLPAIQGIWLISLRVVTTKQQQTPGPRQTLSSAEALCALAHEHLGSVLCSSLVFTNIPHNFLMGIITALTSIKGQMSRCSSPNDVHSSPVNSGRMLPVRMALPM